MTAAAVPSRADFYAKLLSQAKPLLSSTSDSTACMANLAALIYHSLQKSYGADAVNWCGFYVLREVTFLKQQPPDEHDEDTQSSQHTTTQPTNQPALQHEPANCSQRRYCHVDLC